MRALPLLILTFAVGCDSRPATTPAPPVGKALAAGDPAPPLTVAKWLHGSAVEIKPGTVYVVDFWATWCGPCIRAMPHLEGLKRQYGPKGVEIVAVTTADEQGNTLERVERYIKDTGHRYSFSFAWCDTVTTFDDWMAAAGQSGLPTSFVVDRAGKIAYIGHPNDLDFVLPRVVDGTWRGKADVAALEQLNHRKYPIFSRVALAGENAASKLPLTATEPERVTAYNAAAALAVPKALEELAQFAKDFPSGADADDVLAEKMVLLMRVKKYDEAKTLADTLLKRAATIYDLGAINHVRLQWLGTELNPDRKNLDVAVTAAEMLLAIRTDEDVEAVLAAAHSYAAAGNAEKFEAYARKARLLTALDAERGKKVEAALKSFQK